MAEHPHPYGALYHQIRAEALEAALITIRDFEPVTNGDYAIEVAMPKMREIAMRALVSTARETEGDAK